MSLSSPSRRILNKNSFVCSDCRKWLAAHPQRSQQRWISQNHLRKIKVSEQEWQNRKQTISGGQAKSILQKLEERGFINQIIGNRDDLEDVLVQRRIGVYCGIDPTAASLHVGHMVPLVALGWMYIHGYASTFLLGGFTASIGDPTDRLTARPDKETKDRKADMVAMFDQLKRLSASMERYAERKGIHREWAWRRAVKNNSEWWSKVTVKDFMRLLGGDMRIGPMLGRDTVKNRLSKGDGMSYAEFSYPLFQGWDWWHLFQTGTQLQIGGADQFGNILAGAEAVKKIMQKDKMFQQKYQVDLKDTTASGDPMGFTVPLLTTSSGEKFGKSAGNAIWIDRQLTSSFDLYQFFLRSADEDVEKYLKLLTFIPTSEIQAILDEHNGDPSKRIAQHRLAFDFVEMVHGLGAAQEAQEQHTTAFSKTLSIDEVKAQMQRESKMGSDGRPADLHPSLNKHASPLTFDSSYNTNIKLPKSLVFQQPLSRIMWSAGLAASRSEAQRLINNKGAYIGGRIGKNGEILPIGDQVSYVPATDSKWSFVEPLIIGGNLLLLRTGKWKKKFIEIVSDEDYEASGETCPGWKEESETTTSPLATADLSGEEFFRKQGRQNQQTAEQRVSDTKFRRSGGFGEVQGARYRNG